MGHLGKALKAGLAGLMLVAAAPAAYAGHQAQPPMSTPDLIEALQGGGLVLIIRHERTEVPSRDDDYSQPTECRVQRNLSLAGAAGAEETGVALRALDIEVDRVLTSPMCRAADTARYMFGVDYEHAPSLMHHIPGGERNLDVAEAEVRAMLRELAPDIGNSNVALITHGGTVLRISGLRLNEGEMAVLRLSETGDITVLGEVSGSRLGAFARIALQSEE